MANVKMKRVPCGEEKLKISNDQELEQSESNAHPKTQKGNDQKHTVSRTSNYFPKGCHSVTCMNAHTKGAQIKTNNGRTALEWNSVVSSFLCWLYRRDGHVNLQ